MYPILISSARNQMSVINEKMNKILNKYETDEDLHVKDLADLEKYSEILKNLSVYLDSFYGKW